MKKFAGIWIDQKKAIIASIRGEREKINIVRSNLGGRHRSHIGKKSSTPFGPQEGYAEQKEEIRRKRILQHYFDEIITCIRDADHIFIFGPAEARIHLGTALKKHKQIAHKILINEPSGEMSERQIMGKTREYIKRKKQFL